MEALAYAEDDPSAGGSGAVAGSVPFAGAADVAGLSPGPATGPEMGGEDETFFSALDSDENPLIASRTNIVRA